MPQQQEFIAKVYNIKRTLFTDQTGNFRETSGRSNQYKIAISEIDSITTWIKPMSNRTKQAMITEREHTVKSMRVVWVNPIRQILENEASAKYEEAITKPKMTYQLAPPDDHMWNIAEKAIQFWKDHFIAVLSGITTIYFPFTCGARPPHR